MTRRLLEMTAVLLAFAAVTTAQSKEATKTKPHSPPVEARVRKLWEAFKNKDKATLSSLIDDGFRQFEEGLTTFGDKKTEVNAVDEYELIRYALSDFNIKPLGSNTNLITYIA